MALIADIGTTIDSILYTYVSTVFGQVATPMRNLLSIGATIALIFLALNHLLQFKQIDYSEYIHFAVKYALVFAFATYWSNFSIIYGAIQSIPNDYMQLLLKAAALGYHSPSKDMFDPEVAKQSTYHAMDEFAKCIKWMSDRFMEDTSADIGKSIKNVFTGVVILAVGAFFTAACAVIVIIGKVGFAVAISLAPLGLVLLMTEQTKSYFQNWMHFTIGFVVLPLITGALMAVVLFVASNIMEQGGADAHQKDKFFPFIFVMVGSIFLIFQLPQLASSLAGSSVATMGGGAVWGAAQRMWQSGKKWGDRGMRGARRARDGVDTYTDARKKGAGIHKAAWVGLQGMRQSSLQRSQRRDDRLAKRMAVPKKEDDEDDTNTSGANGSATAYPTNGNKAQAVAQASAPGGGSGATGGGAASTGGATSSATRQNTGAGARGGAQHRGSSHGGGAGAAAGRAGGAYPAPGGAGGAYPAPGGAGGAYPAPGGARGANSAGGRYGSVRSPGTHSEHGHVAAHPSTRHAGAEAQARNGAASGREAEADAEHRGGNGAAAATRPAAWQNRGPGQAQSGHAGNGEGGAAGGGTGPNDAATSAARDATSAARTSNYSASQAIQAARAASLQARQGRSDNDSSTPEESD